jgi:hypothetical protein
MTSIPSTVIFIRHNWDQPELIEYNKQLYSDQKIAIHFDRGGLDESRYKGAGKTAIAKFKQANRESALVVAAYEEIDSILLGKISVGSLRTEEVQLDVSRELKTLLLHDCVEVKFSDFPTLFLIQPPYGTIVEWKMGKKAVNAYYNFRMSGSKERPISLEFLSPWQLEILCEEYLREKLVLKHKLFATGKFMKGFDVVGLGCKGEHILAQVKHSGTKKQFSEFEAMIKDAPPGSRSFYFDSAENLSSFSKNTKCDLVSVESVYTHFEQTNPEFLKELVYGFSEAA